MFNIELDDAAVLKSLRELQSRGGNLTAANMEIAEAMLKTIYVLPGLSAQIKTGRKP